MFQHMWTVVVIGGAIACAGMAITLGMVIMDCVINSSKPVADGHVTVSEGLRSEACLQLFWPSTGFYVCRMEGLQQHAVHKANTEPETYTCLLPEC